MVKKKKKVAKESSNPAASSSKEQVGKIIEEHVAKRCKDLTDEERKMQVDALKKVFIDGKKPYEAMGLPKDFSKLLYKQAYDEFGMAHYKQANHLFRMLCLLDPQSAKYWMGLAATNHVMENYRLAATFYLLTYYNDPDSPIPFYHMSDCFLKMDQPSAAHYMLRLCVDNCDASPNPAFSKLKNRCYMMMKGLKEKYNLDVGEEEETAAEGGGIFAQIKSEAESALQKEEE